MHYVGIQGKLYPNSIQLNLIRKHIGCSRFIRNYYLSYAIENYKNGIKTNYYDWCKDLTNLKKQSNYHWLNEVLASSLQQSLKN